MKKNIKSKIAKPEAIYASQSITRTTQVLFNILEILKNKKLIQLTNFLYAIERLEFFNSNHENFKLFFFGTKDLKNNTCKKQFVNNLLIEERLLQQKLNILLKYFNKKNQIKFKKIAIEILDYIKKIYNQNIGDLLDMMDTENRYEIVPLTDIFILIENIKTTIQ